MMAESYRFYPPFGKTILSSLHAAYSCVHAKKRPGSHREKPGRYPIADRQKDV